MRKIDTVLESPMDCCGCGNCIIKCPKKCISWERKPGGFHYPKIDLNLCIDCKICEKVCPEIEPIQPFTDEPEVYAAYAKDSVLRKKSSSGGIFGELASAILEQNGVVFGASFDKGFSLRASYAERSEDLFPLYKSKYVESRLDNTFFQVEHFLKEGRKVLFCSTTCQCHALLKFLKIQYENLLLVDILCHGVISQEIFSKVMEYYENRHDIKIEKFSFRYKGPGMSSRFDHSFVLTGLRKNKIKEITGSSYQFPYYQLYLTYQAFRVSCYDCKFAQIHRPTDITLGDFWKLERYQACDDFKKGYSLVILRTNRGKKAFENVKSKLVLQKYSMKEAIATNPTVSRGTDPKKFNREFFDDYETQPISYVVKKYMNVKTDLFHRLCRFVKRKIRL